MVRAANRMRCWRRCGILLCSKPRRSMPVYMRLSCGDRLPVAPRGNFLSVEKVTKGTFKRRGFRFPRLLKTSTLEPAKRNRARFSFDSFRGAMDEQRRLVSNSVNEQVFLLNRSSDMQTKKIAKIFGIIILAAIIAATLAVMVFERYIVQRSQYEIPVLSDHGIFYGDTPAEVSRKLGTTAVSKEKLPYAPETYIRYNAAILGSNAEITCYFLYGRYLTEADIYITSESAAQADELFTQAAALIEEEYSEQPGFTVGGVQHKGDGSYSRSFSLSFGATGIDYTLKVQENSLSISCRKLF